VEENKERERKEEEIVRGKGRRKRKKEGGRRFPYPIHNTNFLQFR
jgi:hypothetical protein